MPALRQVKENRTHIACTLHFRYGGGTISEDAPAGRIGEWGQITRMVVQDGGLVRIWVGVNMF